MSAVSTFTTRGVFIGVNGTSTDLEMLVWRQVVAGRLGGAASTDSGFSSLCRHVATNARAEFPQTLASRPLGPLGLVPGPLGPHVKYTPVVMIILTFGQHTLTSLEMLQFGTYISEIK
jgi:hypothetical protein